jgi:hypothetical protein
MSDSAEHCRWSDGDYSVLSESDYSIDYTSDCGSLDKDVNNKKYVILHESDIQSKIDSIINIVSQELDINYYAAQRLLLMTNWNKTMLMDLYFNNTFVFPEHDPIGECPICFDNECNITINDCKHSFCSECLETQYSLIINPKCPAVKCKNICSLDIIGKLTNIKPYNDYIIKSFINNVKSIKYCPSKPFCGYLIENDSSDMVKCKCGLEWCFKCSSTETHEPISCQQKIDWEVKNTDEKNSAIWLYNNTKTCPHCNRIVQKADGCNHIYCDPKYGGCKGYFCWLCGGKVGRAHSWTSIEGHTCSKLKVTEDTSDLERYGHYYNQQVTHRSGVKLDKEILNNLKVNDFDYSNEYNIMVSAYKQLMDTRLFIANSFIYAYFEFKDINTNVLQGLFEDQQIVAIESLEELGQLVSITKEHKQLADILNVMSKLDNLVRKVSNKYEIINSLERLSELIINSTNFENISYIIETLQSEFNEYKVIDNLLTEINKYNKNRKNYQKIKSMTDILEKKTNALKNTIENLYL